MKTHLNPQAEAVAKALSPDEIADIDRAIRAMSIEQRLRIARVFHNRCLVRQGGMQLPPPHGSLPDVVMECAIVERIPALQAYGLVIVAVNHGSLGVEEEVIANG